MIGAQRRVPAKKSDTESIPAKRQRVSKRITESRKFLVKATPIAITAHIIAPSGPLPATTLSNLPESPTPNPIAQSQPTPIPIASVVPTKPAFSPNAIEIMTDEGELLIFLILNRNAPDSGR